MNIIAHRINTLQELRALDKNFGVELDLRDNLDGSIYIQHNPFEAGEDFEPYLKYYSEQRRGGTMILNIKSERIELKILELLRIHEIADYFFLDSSFPMIKLLADQGERNIALRFSELEGLDTIRNMAGLAKWIWVDCFTRLPITRKIEHELRSMGYKLCLVSPELEGQPERITEYRDFLRNEDIIIDAVCTKAYNAEKWLTA